MDPKERYEKERSEGKQQRLFTVLEAAERVFNQKGIEKTTMQDIAADANIGIATLFRYFPKKEKLIVAVATKLLEPMHQRFQYVAELPLSCLEQLEILFDFFIEDHHHSSIKFMVDFESYASHASEPLEDIHNINAMNRMISSEYSKIIQNGIEDGSIRSDLPVKETLTTLINTFGLFSKKLSLQKNILLFESDLETDHQLAILKNIFMDYLKA
ncbi:TetR/AcrR family transcriptional regulator [Paenibacillus sp. PL91]|uniref:TetR/AcrR family transcriptional regulator n=1 Tax=Paenibacillus sp. PL91 TaxID=2729538 RepID=UPI00145EA724|nr:TetR/AcrR family transcriptional regulator [Paenibacillus sp. PL91]MBC9201604.1 TetR/AcrR family transcriptional regulator [Paenibacillus sp. PL91]